MRGLYLNHLFLHHHPASGRLLRCVRNGGDLFQFYISIISWEIRCRYFHWHFYFFIRFIIVLFGRCGDWCDLSSGFADLLSDSIVSTIPFICHVVISILDLTSSRWVYFHLFLVASSLRRQLCFRSASCNLLNESRHCFEFFPPSNGVHSINIHLAI